MFSEDSLESIKGFLKSKKVENHCMRPSLSMPAAEIMQVEASTSKLFTWQQIGCTLLLLTVQVGEGGGVRRSIGFLPGVGWGDKDSA